MTDRANPSKLMIATPIYGGAQGSYVGSVVELMALAAKEGFDCSYATLSHNPSINRARNVMAAGFLASDCTHLLFLDDDIGFEPDQLIDLVRRMESDDRLAIAGAPYPRREIAWEQVDAASLAGLAQGQPGALESAGGQYAMELLEPGAPLRMDEPVELSKLGTGLMVIRRDVLEKLTERHTDLRYVIPGREGELTAFFHPLIDPDTRRLLSDDYAFCHRARAAGFRIWAAPWMRTTHTGPATFAANLTDLARLQSAARGKAEA